MKTLTGNARLAGLVGYPVSFSQAPAMHGYWLQKYDIDGIYVPLPVREGEFATAIAGLRAAGFRGCNITKPHKQEAAALCDRMTEAAERMGAVNTLVFEEDGISGFNTDGFGFLAGLEQNGIAVDGRHVLVLGAGGACRSIAMTLAEAGAAVTLTNRTRSKAEALALELGGLKVIDWEQRADALAEADVLVNTTSLGMLSQPPLEMDLSRARDDLAVTDIVYAPQKTELLKNAESRGLRIMNGLPMLMNQARPGFAKWFGVEPEIDAGLEKHLVERMQASAK